MKKNISLLILILLGLSVIVPVFAQQPMPIPETQSLESIITKITWWVFYLFFALAIIFLVVAAFNFLTAAGDLEKTGKARSQLTYAVVAIAIALLAKAIPFMVRAFLV